MKIMTMIVIIIVFKNVHNEGRSKKKSQELNIRRRVGGLSQEERTLLFCVARRVNV